MRKTNAVCYVLFCGFIVFGILLSTMSPQELPRKPLRSTQSCQGHPRASQEPSRTPKDFPRSPKSSQGAPKSPQGAPKSPQGASRISQPMYIFRQGAPKSSQGAPKISQSLRGPPMKRPRAPKEHPRALEIPRKNDTRRGQRRRRRKTCVILE